MAAAQSEVNCQDVSTGKILSNHNIHCGRNEANKDSGNFNTTSVTLVSGDSVPAHSLSNKLSVHSDTLLENNSASAKGYVVEEKLYEIHRDAISVAGDGASLSSKSSRHGRFFRGLSIRRSRAVNWLSSRLNKHNKGSDLSAAFNLLDQKSKSEMVNLNTASEEELMTVEGITRAMAHSIIEYRSAIGGFRSVQDLALVSGIGAARMAALCRDLTVISTISELPEEASPCHPSSTVSAPTPSPAIQLSSQTTFFRSSVSSPNDSSVPSYASSPSTAQTSQAKSGVPVASGKVNVNSATIFELMGVPGINQEMAANIVHYREKKGPFKTVDEIARVRSVGSKQTRLIQAYLTVYHDAEVFTRDFQLKDASTGVFCGNSVSHILEPCLLPANAKTSPIDPKLPTLTVRADLRSRHRRTLSAPSQPNENDNDTTRRKRLNEVIIDPVCSASKDVDDEFFKIALGSSEEKHESFLQSLETSSKNGHRLSVEFSADVYELLSLRSERPEIHGIFENTYNGRAAVRIATWNLSQVTFEKISNPGVLEVFCRTILERGISVLAVQDLLSRHILDKIVAELNTGSLRRVREWPSQKGAWEFVQTKNAVGKYTVPASGLDAGRKTSTNEYLGFLYNTRIIRRCEDFVLESISAHPFVCKPFIARFEVSNLVLTLSNVHVRPSYSSCRNSSTVSCRGCLSAPSSSPHRSFIKEDADALKSVKNLQNGLIKDGTVSPEQLRNGSVNSGHSSLVLSARNSSDFQSSIGDADTVDQQIATVLNNVVHEGDRSKMLILGDFFVDQTNKGMERLRSAGYVNVQGDVSSSAQTSVSSSSSAPELLQTGCIWISPSLQPSFTGCSSVVTEGLTHLAVPRGWGWGGLATSHCLLYSDFYTD